MVRCYCKKCGKFLFHQSISESEFPINVLTKRERGFNQLLQNGLSKFVQQQLFEPPVPVTEADAQPRRLNR